MTNGWRTVELGNVMQIEIDAVPVDAQPEFQMAGVYSFARGLFKREALPNTQTTYKFFHRLHKDMFVVSVPKGWEGALARVSDDFDGMFLSPVFPTFRANPKELDIRYFEWYCRQSKIWDELRRKSRGIGARRESISAEKFLSLEIPVPPLNEQRRIVEYIETLSTRIAAITQIRNEQYKDIRGLLLSLFNKVTADAPVLPMQQIAPIIRRPAIIELDADYPEVGIRSFGKGTFHKPSINGAALGTKRLFRIEPNDLLFSNVFAWEGAVAVAKKEDNGRFGSHRFISCLPKEKIATSEFLCFYFLTKDGLGKLGTASPGGAGRNRTLGLNALENILVPVPEYEKQVWFDSVQARLASLRELQSATGEELSALMPSVLDRAFKGEL